jgi:hypothetical protein
MDTGGLANVQSDRPGVRWTNVSEQKAQSSKSLCPTRPRKDLVSRPQSRAADESSAGPTPARFPGSATPAPGRGGRQCQTKATAGPMLKGKGCSAGNARDSPGPRESSTCRPASRSSSTHASIVAVDGIRETSHDRWRLSQQTDAVDDSSPSRATTLLPGHHVYDWRVLSLFYSSLMSSHMHAVLKL